MQSRPCANIFLYSAQAGEIYDTISDALIQNSQNSAKENTSCYAVFKVIICTFTDACNFDFWPFQVMTFSWWQCTSWAMHWVWNIPMTQVQSWRLSTNTWRHKTSNCHQMTFKASRKYMVENLYFQFIITVHFYAGKKDTANNMLQKADEIFRLYINVKHYILALHT